MKKFPLFGGEVAVQFGGVPQVMRNQLSRWKKQGLIVMLKKGLYALSQNEREGKLSKEFISASLYQPSYISLETALSYHKMIPEKVVPVTAVTTRKTKSFQNDEGLFLYRQLKPTAYFGFKSARDGSGFPYYIAEPEKALLDYLYFNLGSIQADDADYFRSALRLQNRSVLNREKLFSYAKRFGIKKLLKILGNLP